MHLSLSVSLWNYSSPECVIESCPITPMELGALWITPTWEKCLCKKHLLYVKRIQRIFNNPGIWFGHVHKGESLYMQAILINPWQHSNGKRTPLGQVVFDKDVTVCVSIGVSSQKPKTLTNWKRMSVNLRVAHDRALKLDFSFCKWRDICGVERGWLSGKVTGMSFPVEDGKRYPSCARPDKIFKPWPLALILLKN